MNATRTAYDEMIDFLTSGPSLEDIAAFRHSEATVQRVAYLKRAAQHDQLSEMELHELREFRRAEHFLDMIRVRAMRRLGRHA